MSPVGLPSASFGSAKGALAAGASALTRSSVSTSSAKNRVWERGEKARRPAEAGEKAEAGAAMRAAERTALATFISLVPVYAYLALEAVVWVVLYKIVYSTGAGKGFAVKAEDASYFVSSARSQLHPPNEERPLTVRASRSLRSSTRQEGQFMITSCRALSHRNCK